MATAGASDGTRKDRAEAAFERRSQIEREHEKRVQWGMTHDTEVPHDGSS
jgi:hypothetical protein